MRHPLDVIPSLAALCSTISHCTKPNFEFYRDYPEYWHWFVKKKTRQIRRYFNTLIEQCRRKKHPLYIVRYEDLVNDGKNTLMGLFSFLLEEPDLVGSNIERRLDHFLPSITAVKTYKLKETTGKFDFH